MDSNWQVGLKTLASRTAKLLYSEHLSDCSFRFECDSEVQIIPAHRFILAATSPVFEAMLYGKMAKNDNEPIDIADIQPQTFKAMLEYIYTDQINLEDFELACEIMRATHKYMIESLFEICSSYYIMQQLCPGNACHVFELASLLEKSDLIDASLKMIEKRTDEILNEKSFEKIDTATLKTILLQDALNLDELKLWEGSVRWARQECSRQGLDVTPSNQRSILQDVFNLFRFLTLSAKEFAEGPALSEILTEKESHLILMNIISPNSKELPQYISGNRERRLQVPMRTCRNCNVRIYSDAEYCEDCELRRCRDCNRRIYTFSGYCESCEDS